MNPASSSTVNRIANGIYVDGERLNHQNPLFGMQFV